MIEFLFAVTLGVGSVVLATISLGELVHHTNSQKEIKDIPVDYVFNLITANPGDIYVNDTTIHNAGLFKSIDTSTGKIGYQIKSQNNREGLPETDIIIFMNKTTNTSAEFRRDNNESAYIGKTDDPAIIEAIEALKRDDRQLNEMHQ